MGHVGGAVGTTVGETVGCSVVGAVVGASVVGSVVGSSVVGSVVGTSVVGSVVGCSVVGAVVGSSVVGSSLGIEVLVGGHVGHVGAGVGATLGCRVLGSTVGSSVVGSTVGSSAVSQAILMFQGIVSRNIGPGEAAVLSVTEMKGGAAYNVIPDKVSLRGCTRHFKPQIQDLIESRMREVLRGLEVSLGVATDMSYTRRCPALANSPKETEEALHAASLVVGSGRVFGSVPPVMASEDFSVMLENVPGAYVALGAGLPRPNGMTHQPGYDFNDRLISIGAAYWVNLVESLLPEK